MSSESESSMSTENELQEAAFIGKMIQYTMELAEEYDAESSRSTARSATLQKLREVGHNRLVEDYIVDDAVYASKFRGRFQMRKQLFLRIGNALETRFPYFQRHRYGRGKLGFFAIQKCTSAIQQLAFDTGSDSWNEYLRMPECNSRESLHKFAKAIRLVFEARYLRKPTRYDTYQLYNVHEIRHEFPGMLGSIDCMHWPWAMCPTAWHGQYMRGDHKESSIILEAVTSHDLWFWHAFFGVAGANNDINVLDQSPVFKDIYRGIAVDLPFQANGVTYKRGYYLTDEIYPELSVFVKSWTTLNDEKRTKFKAAQEGASKDIGRAFIVLKKHWQIPKAPTRSWDVNKIQNIMYACVILHNMVLEDEGKAICCFDDVEPLDITSPQYLINRREVRNWEMHHNLRADLVEHIFHRELQEYEINDDGLVDDDTDEDIKWDDGVNDDSDDSMQLS